MEAEGSEGVVLLKGTDLAKVLNGGPHVLGGRRIEGLGEDVPEELGGGRREKISRASRG